MSLRKRKSQLKLSNYLGRFGRKTQGLFINWPKLPDSYLLDKELKERMDGAIRHMPIKYRLPLLLDNVEELPLKISADILGLKINSLKTRLHRAHQMLKVDISDYFRDKQPWEDKTSLNCNVWISFVYDYVKGFLGKSKNTAFRRHIKDCASCNSFLDAYLKAINITSALECQDLPQQLKDRIETFLRKPR